jgi:uroporphyrinogen-III decarboxylase
MTGRERMDAAMRPALRSAPDRVPVMCQLALGHYFLNAGLPPVDIWYDSNAFADALVTMQRRYGFDGILVNLPGRDPGWRDAIAGIEERDGETLIRWIEGATSIVPRDDNPRVRRKAPSFEAIDPDRLHYIEPHDRIGVVMLERFPPWQSATLRRVRELAPDISVHGEVFSPFSQLAELLGIAEVMLALIDDPSKVRACVDRLAGGAAELGTDLLTAGADAVLISSAFAGAGFISRRHYEEFVLPFEQRTIERIRAAAPQAIVYTHTCGAIGDRLDLMQATGTDGIDTLDPPPLGTVDLAEARRQLDPRLFIKGNIDPVNTVLRGTPQECYEAAEQRIAAAGTSGFILSTACSVPPRAPAENILAIARAAREWACVA